MLGILDDDVSEEIDDIRSRYSEQISPHREFHHAGISITGDVVYWAFKEGGSVLDKFYELKTT
jgi:hypothetical protein